MARGAWSMGAGRMGIRSLLVIFSK